MKKWQRGSVALFILLVVVIIVAALYFFGIGFGTRNFDAAPPGKYPRVLTTYTCSSTLYWNFIAGTYQSWETDDTGTYTVTNEIVDLILYDNNSPVYDATISGREEDWAEEYLYHLALADLSNHRDPLEKASSTSSSLLQQSSDLKKLALTCLYQNFPTDTTGSLPNFEKTIPLPTTVGATFALLPGQSATGVAAGENVTLSVDSTSPYVPRLLINGVEQKINGGMVPDIGNIYFDPAPQFADGTASWTVRSSN